MERKKNELQFLNEKQIRCIEMLCQENAEITKVAKELGISRQTVYNWLKDAKFKATLDECEQDIKNRVHHAFVLRLPAAVERLWELGGSADNRTKLQATKEWIERAIGKTITEITLDDNRKTNDGLSLDDIVAKTEQLLKDTPIEE